MPTAAAVARQSTAALQTEDGALKLLPSCALVPGEVDPRAPEAAVDGDSHLDDRAVIHLTSSISYVNSPSLSTPSKDAHLRRQATSDERHLSLPRTSRQR
jgi:hypothetical protein